MHSSLLHRGNKTRVVLLEERLVDYTDVSVIEHFSLVEPVVHTQLVFEHSLSSLGLFGSVAEDFVNANFL